MDDCIVWPGAKFYDGYGRVKVNYKHKKAHRVAWERKNGPIPEGMLVDHLCGVRPCVNTDHMRLASHRENNQNLAGKEVGVYSSKYPGVYFHPKNGKWIAGAKFNGKLKYLGSFTLETDAAQAYREAVS